MYVNVNKIELFLPNNEMYCGFTMAYYDIKATIRHAPFGVTTDDIVKLLDEDYLNNGIIQVTETKVLRGRSSHKMFNIEASVRIHNPYVNKYKLLIQRIHYKGKTAKLRIDFVY